MNKVLNRGFTLIEVMIVVLIVGILAAIAYPSYLDSVRKSNRADAKVALNNAAQQLQRCYTLDNSYANCQIDTTSPEGFYTIALNANASTYSLTATAAKSPQTGDTGCINTMGLNNLGQKTPNPDPKNCW
jgi:type IV pilus assembly protein PilE